MPRNRKAALGFIFVTLLIDVIGLGIIIPVMPSLIVELIDGDLSTASQYGGWLIFAYAIMQFFCAPILGGLSDRFGRRSVLLISLFGFGLDYLFLAFAPTIGWLFVGRVIAGIMGASFTTATAYIADVSSPEKRAQNFGLVGAAFGLGFIIGPVIGGIIGFNFGPRAPFMAAACLTLVNWLYGYFILPESLPKDRRRKFDWKRANPIGSLMQFKKYPVVLGLVASIVLIYLSAHATQSTWNYYTMEKFGWNEAWVGYSLGAIGLMIALVQGVLIRIIIPKIGQERGVYIGLTLYCIGFVLFAFASEGWMMFAFLIPYALGGIAGPSLQGIMAGQVNSNEQGELQGAMTSLVAATSIIGPPMMTNLFAYFTKPENHIYFPGAPFLMGAVLSLISSLLARRTLKASLTKV